MHSQPVGVGAAAPDFALRGSSHQSLCLAALRGRPVVVAFADGFRPAGESADEVFAIRAQLRGLGAMLVVLSDTGAWSFRPDDDVERFAESSAELDADIAEAARRYGLPPRAGAASPAIFVVDGDGVVRFAHAGSTRRAEVLTTLASALDAAGRALTARPTTPLTLTRRELVMSSLVAGFVLAFVDGCSAPPAPAPPVVGPPEPGHPAAGDLDIVLHVNGAERPVRIDPRVSLLDALRERLALTGTKKGCDHGQCGACTVLVDGRRVNACLTLAIMVQGAKITTIEGLAHGDELHPVQAAFIAQDGFQCGYCTPGQIMSAVALLAEGHAKSDDEVREEMSGNLCRCGAYPNIVAAVQLARDRAGSAGKGA
jgi:xanthine dehydrogenase YagT iron-sulfur-binding subunit